MLTKCWVAKIKNYFFRVTPRSICRPLL